MNGVFWALLAGLLLLGVPGARRRPRLVVLAALLYGLDELLVMLPVWNWSWLGFGLRYNWTGKLLSGGLTLALVYGLRLVSPAEAGLRRPAPGSGRRVLPVVLGLAALQFGGAFWFRHTHAPPPPGWEKYLYQLTMPGLAEELFLRGLWLGLLARALPRTLPFFGTRTSWGGLLGLLLFGLGHVLSFDQGPLQWLPTVSPSPGKLLEVLCWGTLFLWVRERTGSVWAAVATHNLVNTVLYLGMALP